jgi:hypothetical protein
MLHSFRSICPGRWAIARRNIIPQFAGSAGAPGKPQDKNACAPVLDAEDYAALAGTATTPPGCAGSKFEF